VVPILTGLFWASLLIQDCFLDAASELDASPEVAILQHESDVMLVIGHYFENGEYICFCCSDGTRAFVLTQGGFALRYRPLHSQDQQGDFLLLRQWRGCLIIQF